MHQLRCSSPRQLSISLRKVAGALVRSNGILSHSQNPKGPTVKAVSCLDILSISTCRYLLLRSRDINMTDPPRQSSVSSILGRLYASLIVHELSLQRSMQNLNDPSFFQTNTTALAQGLLDFLIDPISSISLRCFFTSSY